MKKLRSLSIELPSDKGIPENLTGSLNIVDSGSFISINTNHQTESGVYNQRIQLRPSTFLLLEQAIKEFKVLKI